MLEIRIRKRTLEAVLILFFISIYGLFSRYIGYTGLWNNIMILIVVYVLVTNNYKVVREWISSKAIVVSSVLSISFLIMSVFFTSSNSVLIENLQLILYPALMCFLIWHYNQSDGITSFFNNMFVFFNLMWLINLFVLSRQVSGTGFMIKDEWFAINNFYPDQCAGLFGNSGTHELGMFSIFILVYNFYYANYKSRNRKLILIYTFFSEMLMLIFSTYNENMALFILLPLFGFIYILLKNDWINHNIFNKIVGYGKYIFIAFFLIVIAGLLPGIGEYIQSELFNRISNIFLFDVSLANGSNERLAIPMYALINGFGWMFGSGFGSWGIHLGGFLNFNHFGLNSAGSFIALGGIWFYISYCSLYASTLKEICYRNVAKGNLWFVSMVVIVGLSVYTTIFTSAVSVVWLALTFSIFGEMKKEIMNDQKKY